MWMIIISIFLSTTHASDEWLCKEEASIQRGNSIYACGIAKGATEQDARESSFYAAQNEFTRIHPSLKKVEIEAKRTECEPIPQVKDAFMPGQNYYQFKCYRLVVFTITD